MTPRRRLPVLDVVLGFDLVLDRRAGGDAVELEHRSADAFETPPPPAGRSLALRRMPSTNVHTSAIGPTMKVRKARARST